MLATALLIAAATTAAAMPPAPPAASACMPPTGLVFVGDNATPPYEFVDGEGRPTGFSIDLIRALSAEVGVPIEIRLMPRSQAMAAIDSGAAQLTNLGHTTARERRFDFLGPLLYVRASIVVRSGLRPQAKSLDDLAGLTVAVEQGTLTHEQLVTLPSARRIGVRPAVSRREAVRMWARGEVDGVAGFASSVIWMARREGIVDLMEVPYQRTTFELTTRRGCGDAFAPLAAAIVKLRGEGQLGALGEKWLTSATPPAFPWRIAALVGGALAAMALTGWIWLWSLRRQVRERTHALREALASQQQLTIQAEAATRAKSAFLATMSHEIRTPLNAVIATASLLERAVLPPDQRELVAVIRKGGDSLLSVVGDVLDFSKIEAGRLELDATTFDMRALLHDTVALVEGAAAAKGLRITAEVGPSFPRWLQGDGHRIRQVVLNLLTNAVKFTDRGGVDLWAVAQPTDEQGRARVRIAVSDTGPGIAADRIDRLFEPFTQADSSTTRRFGGTGLGLAISRHLVELMGGTLAASSKEGEGSTFTVTVALPVAEAPRAVTARMTDRASLSRLRVLLAEDNPVNQMVEQRILQSLHVKCDVAENGQAAVDAVSASQYDVVLLDLQMPVMDGFEAAKRIRNTPNPPWLVAVTADVSAETQRQCAAAGFDDFVSKPVTVKEIACAFARRPAA